MQHSQHKWQNYLLKKSIFNVAHRCICTHEKTHIKCYVTIRHLQCKKKKKKQWLAVRKKSNQETLKDKFIQLISSTEMVACFLKPLAVLIINNVLNSQLVQIIILYLTMVEPFGLKQRANSVLYKIQGFADIYHVNTVFCDRTSQSFLYQDFPVKIQNYITQIP